MSEGSGEPERSMSEGSGEPEREQDPWSQPTDSAQPGPAAAEPEVAGYPSAGPDSWSTTRANPAWPARPIPPGQPGGLDGTDLQLPSPANGFSPAAADPSTAPSGGLQPPAGAYPQAGQYQPAPGQDPPAAGSYPQAGQYDYQPAPGQDPQAAGAYPQAGQYGYQPTPGQYPQAAEQYGPQQWPAYPARQRNNRVAIAALVCGVAQFVLGLLIVGNILLAIPAIICGAIGLKQTRQRGEGGRGMAIAGLVLGILGVMYFVIIVLVLIILGSIHHGGST